MRPSISKFSNLSKIIVFSPVLEQYELSQDRFSVLFLSTRKHDRSYNIIGSCMNEKVNQGQARMQGSSLRFYQRRVVNVSVEDQSELKGLLVCEVSCRSIRRPIALLYMQITALGKMLAPSNISGSYGACTHIHTLPVVLRMFIS